MDLSHTRLMDKIKDLPVVVDGSPLTIHSHCHPSQLPVSNSCKGEDRQESCLLKFPCDVKLLCCVTDLSVVTEVIIKTSSRPV